MRPFDAAKCIVARQPIIELFARQSRGEIHVSCEKSLVEQSISRPAERENATFRHAPRPPPMQRFQIISLRRLIGRITAPPTKLLFRVCRDIVNAPPTLAIFPRAAESANLSHTARINLFSYQFSIGTRITNIFPTFPVFFVFFSSFSVLHCGVSHPTRSCR